MTNRNPVRVRAYAKVNLFLRVLGRRPDGFHELETILHGVGVSDDIEVSQSTGTSHVTMRMSAGTPGEAPEANANLVMHALSALGTHGASAAVDIAIDKSIPIGAGLGGGSSDAAGALVALIELLDLEMSRDTMMQIAGRLGSDVPYFLEGGTVLATGRGEYLTPLSAPSVMWFVLVGPGSSLSTRDVYAAWDDLGLSPGPSSVAMTLAIGAGDAAEVAALLHNDLEPAALALDPGLAGCKDALTTAGALGSSMSGSGPTMLGVARDENHAKDMAETLAGAFPWVRAVSSRQTCIERLD